MGSFKVKKEKKKRKVNHEGKKEKKEEWDFNKVGVFIKMGSFKRKLLTTKFAERR